MKRILSISFLLFRFAAGAQQLTAEQAIATALKNNFDIRLAQNDSMLAAMYSKYANGVFFPDINGLGSLGFVNNNQRQELSNGTVKQKNGIKSENLGASVGLNWTLFDGMKMFVSRDQAYAYQLSKLALQQQVSATVAKVLIAYYAIVREKQRIKALTEQMALYEERVKLADNKLKTGLGAKPEWLQAKVDLNARKAEKMTEEARLDEFRQTLNLLMAVAPETLYDVSDSIPVDKELALGNILTATETGNPDLKTALQDIRLAGLNVKQQKAGLYPTLSFTTAYNFSMFKNKAVINDFTPLQNRNLGFNYGIGTSIPIFNGFTVRKQIKEAEYALDRSRLSFDFQKHQINTAVMKAFREYRMQLDVLELEEENILLAKENTWISSERYRLGITGSLELRETQKSLEDAYDRLIAARYAAKLAETELLRLKGDLVR